LAFIRMDLVKTHQFTQGGIWQVRRESNPQPTVLETVALPIELLT
jgi:hypothetical protein